MENTEFNQRLLEIGNGVFVGSMFVYEKTHCNRIFKVSVNYTTEKFEGRFMIPYTSKIQLIDTEESKIYVIKVSDITDIS